MTETAPERRAESAVEESSLQRAAYDAERAAALPRSDLGRALLDLGPAGIPVESCVAYFRAIQEQAWFVAAFPGHSSPLVVIGGAGASSADPERRLVKIGNDDRSDPQACERACLHELAHIVTAETGPDRQSREPVELGSTHGHHRAWRANFVFIVRMTLGRQAAVRLRSEFRQWGLPMR